MLVPLGAPGHAETPTGVEDFLAPTMQVGQFPAQVDGRAVQLDVTPGALERTTTQALGGHFMRQVDDEAGVAPGGSLADQPGLEHHDLQRRVTPDQLAGR
ncbi:hypothetical protein D3C77_560790 [compost metagenome]